jgi:hypothetical protein
MKKSLFILLIVLFFSFETKAQDYSTGIGLRGGPWAGLTVKHFLNEKVAVEGLFDSRWQGFNLTGLYEIHNRAFNTDRLNWYYGAGAHIGFYDSKHKEWGDNTGSYSIIGIDGILGLEYNFKKIPINLSVDWKPTLNIVGYSGFWGDGGAFSIRYIF